jgi:1-acyl-sn-glycerol-3-phosphate acyltransferase
MAKVRIPKVPKREFGFLLLLVAAVLALLLRLSMRIVSRGHNQIPRSGPYVLVGNHLSYLDPIAVAYVLLLRSRRAPHFLAKESLFRVPLLGWLLPRLGQIPVYRGGGSNEEPLRAARALLEADHGLLIFPEGTLTRDPKLWPMRGKPGAVRLALQSGAPLYPVAHWGVDRILGNYSKRFSPGFWKRVDVVVGPEIDLSEFRGRDLTSEELAQATEKVMRTIANMVGELRGEQPPARLWDPAERGQSLTGNYRKPDA